MMEVQFKEWLLHILSFILEMPNLESGQSPFANFVEIIKKCLIGKSIDDD